MALSSISSLELLTSPTIETTPDAARPVSTSPSRARDPAPMLDKVKRDIQGAAEVWVFGYASLIWRPEFEAAEQQSATVFGYHRALRMKSRINRGTPDFPGLVFGLVRGGSCRGMAYRVERSRANDELDRLWVREMVNGVYDPKWLPCRTPAGIVPALAFTLSRSSPNYTGGLGDEQLLEILRSAKGRYGTTLDYLRETARCLKGCGICDREVERLCTLVRNAGL